MAFCGKCGAELQEGMNFCAKCGNKVGSEDLPSALRNGSGTSAGAIQKSMDLRNESMTELYRMIQYFSKKSVQYGEYDRLNELAGKPSTGYRSPLRKIGIVLIAIGLPLIALVIKLFIDDKEKFSGDNPQYPMSDFLIPLFVLIAVVAIGVVLIVLYRVEKLRHKQKEINTLRRMGDLSQELGAYYLDYGPCVVGYEFTNPQVLQMIANTISVGRADTPQAAINLLLEDAHKANMEYQMARTAYAAERTATAAEAIARTPIYSPTIFIFRG